MPVNPYTQLIRLITDGEPVNASVSNRAPIDLAARTAHLKELLDALLASQLIQVPDAILEPGMAVGTPVYLDIPQNTYRPARSATESQEDGNPALPSAFLAGIIVDKTSDTRGTVGSFGRIVNLTLADWAGVVDAADVDGSGNALPGRYFLSALQQGKMTRTVSGLGVYVGELNPEGVFYVKAGIPDYASHTHHKFPLVPLPAVSDRTTDLTQDGITGRWTINAGQGDDTEQGWLPADPAEGFTQAEWVPAGINVAQSFYYNLNHPSETALRALFPPVPVDSYVVIKGEGVMPGARIIVNEFGIWWTENRNTPTEAAPWSDNIETSNPDDEEDIDFWFSRVLLATDGGIVRSLRFSDDSALGGRFVDAGGNESDDGALQIIIDALANNGDTDAGILAVKNIVNGQFVRGPVATRVKGTGGLIVTGSGGNAADGWYGALTLALTNTLLTQGNADSADLNNAKAESLAGARAVTLVAGRTASPTWTVNVAPGSATPAHCASSSGPTSLQVVRSTPRHRRSRSTTRSSHPAVSRHRSPVPSAPWVSSRERPLAWFR